MQVLCEKTLSFTHFSDDRFVFLTEYFQLFKTPKAKILGLAGT